jgi:hypothetical protein
MPSSTERRGPLTPGRQAMGREQAQTAANASSQRGRYHTDRQPGAALQNTAICPAAPPPDAACAAGQSHSTQDTVISPGPHSCPFWHRSG